MPSQDNSILTIQNKNIELAVVEPKSVATRCRVVSTNELVTLRGSRMSCPGEIIEVTPTKIWQHKNTIYVSGEVVAAYVDASKLNIEPLRLTELGPWSPKDECWVEEDDLTFKYFKPIIAAGPRTDYEMEQVIPGEISDNVDTDPIIDAADLHRAGMKGESRELLEDILAKDLRCIDAHAHLGNMVFPEEDTRPTDIMLKLSLMHYEIGVGIGNRSLGENFKGLLRAGHVNNRPYLRCLHGLGLCLWRMEKTDDARKVFEKLLWLNPSDNQGARFCLLAIDGGEKWNPEL